MSNGWIGVDLDGTLAYYDHWRGPDHIGAPIPAMLARVKRWLAEGRDVRIFTARVDGGAVGGEQTSDVNLVEIFIRAWCAEHVGCELPVTCRKDYGMIYLYDDRCVQVETNTGKLVTTRGLE